MADPAADGRAGLADRLAELERAGADARAGRRAALNALEDAIQARDALRASEEKYRTLFESMDQGFCIIEVLVDGRGAAVDYRFVEANPAFGRHTGLTAAVGRRARELVPGLEAHWSEVYGRVAETGEPVRFEQAAPSMGRDYDIYAFRVGDPGRRRVAVLFTDITDRKRREANLSFLAEVGQDLARLTNVGETLDALGAKIGGHFGAARCTFAEVDEEADRYTIAHGWSRPGLPAVFGVWRVGEAVSDDLRRAARAGKALAARGGPNDPPHPPHPAGRGSGAFVAAPLLGDGRLRFALTVSDSAPRDWREDEVESVREIAARVWTRLERARAEEALRRSQQFVERVMQASPGTVYILDIRSRATLYLNREPERDLGYTLEELQALPPQLHPDDLARVPEFMARWDAAADADVLENEVRLRHRSGEYRWRLVRETVFERDAAGGVAKIIGVGVDVTDRKRADEALRESRAFHELVAGLGSDWWFLARVEADGAVVTEFLSDEFTRQLGYTADELMAAGGWAVLVHPDDQPEAGRQMARLLAGETIEGELRHVARDGRVIWHQYRTRPGLDAAGRVVRLYGASRDISARKRTEAALRESEERFRGLAEAVPQIVWTSAGVSVDYYNARWYEYTGLDRGSPADDWAEVIHPDDRPRAQARGERALRTGEEYDIEYRLRRHDGQYRWHIARAVLAPSLGRWFGTATDVHDLREAVAALREREAELARVQAVGRVAGVDVALTGGFTGRRSPEYRRLHGLPDHVTAETHAEWLARLHPDDRDRVDRAFRAAVAGPAGEYHAEYRVVRPADGAVRWIGVRADLERDPAGTPVRFVGAHIDITERKEVEEALRASEGRLRAVAANLPGAAVFVVGPDLRYTMAEGQGLRDAGIAPADYEGKTLAEALPPDLATASEANCRRALGGEPFQTEHAVGGRHFVTRGVPLRGPDGAVSGVLAVSYDITDRVRAEDGRRASEGRLRLLVESVRDHAIFALDAGGAVTSWNPAAGRVFGYAADEVVGRPGDVFFTPEDRAAGLPGRELQAAAAEGRASDDNWAVRKDGRRFWASGATSAVRDADGRLTGFVKVVRDRTEERDAGEAVRRAEERLRLALDAARMGIWTWHVPSNTQTRDANLNRLLGLPAEETAQPFDEFFTHLHPDDRAATAEAFRASVAEGRMLNAEFRIVRPDGAVRWLRDQGDVFGEAGGPDRHMTGACVDITELKEAEAALRDARDRLEEKVKERTAELEEANAARTDLLRRLAQAQEDERRRIARDLHDRLGQFVAALALGLKVAEAEAGPASPAAGRLKRLGELTQEVGRETHRLALELRPTALDDAGLKSALRSYVEAWADQAGLAAEFSAAGLDGVRFPPEAATAVYRAVQEALTNVLKHAGATRVSVLLEHRGGELAAIIEDDGKGFDPDVRPTPGGGLGLLGMRERVGLVGGTVQVEGVPGNGTTVYVRVPVPGAGPAGRP